MHLCQRGYVRRLCVLAGVVGIRLFCYEAPARQGADHCRRRTRCCGADESAKTTLCSSSTVAEHAPEAKKDRLGEVRSAKGFDGRASPDDNAAFAAVAFRDVEAHRGLRASWD
jgi:hypothetical protein